MRGVSTALNSTGTEHFCHCKFSWTVLLQGYGEGEGLPPCLPGGNKDQRPGEVGKDDQLPEMPLRTLFYLSG